MWARSCFLFTIRRFDTETWLSGNSFRRGSATQFTRSLTSRRSRQGRSPRCPNWPTGCRNSGRPRRGRISPPSFSSSRVPESSGATEAWQGAIPSPDRPHRSRCRTFMWLWREYGSIGVASRSNPNAPARTFASCHAASHPSRTSFSTFSRGTGSRTSHATSSWQQVEHRVPVNRVKVEEPGVGSAHGIDRGLCAATATRCALGRGQRAGSLTVMRPVIIRRLTPRTIPCYAWRDGAGW